MNGAQAQAQQFADMGKRMGELAAGREKVEVAA